MDGAIAVSQLCNLLDTIREKRTVSEEEIKKRIKRCTISTIL